MEEHEKIELRSDEVQEILGTPPSWIVRWGTTVIFLVIGVLLLISYLVKYADMISANIIITTPSPPMDVVAESSGRLLQLRIEEKEEVQKDQLIAVIESAANFEDMIWLEKELESFRNSGTRFIPKKNVQLGDVQLLYSHFIKDVEDYKFSSGSPYDKLQLEALEGQIENIKRKISIAKKEKVNTEQLVESAIATRTRYKQLLEDGNASRDQYQEKAEQVLSHQSQLEGIKNRIVDLEGDIKELESQKIRIKRGTAETGNDKYIRVQESLNNLSGGIDEWKQKYLITAPLAGRVSFYSRYNQNQFIKAGEQMMAIIPETEEPIGRAELPVDGAGKVEKGQVVNIHLSEFPSKEFGILQGEVRNISLLPIKNKYIAEIRLKEGLKTTYDKQLNFSHDLSGSAEIKTEERRLIERILDKFLDLVKNQ